MASLLILIMPITVLVLTAIAVVTAAGKAGIMNPGPHGFSEILYVFTSQAIIMEVLLREQVSTRRSIILQAD